ncbi:MAG: TolC family outer membrane protein [Sulfuriferula multivorans]|uniref:TolC family outer membrane protein n=1 Tax=Sulfuriferula multivorans TaxID=1559896 RepID=A0A7C9P002_9PROT|nr:TolC family outer membrane protein [Sulfuriferula multivorans]
MQGRNIILSLVVLTALSTPAVAQAPVTLQDAVKSAVSSNPEVQARWHTFLSAQNEQNVARGGYFPRVDITTGIGRESLTQPNQPTTNLTRRGAVLSFNQMIYDGFSTRDEVARLAYAKLVRYYEVLDASETTALETARAYLDVLRYRELSTLAQENYAQHEQVFNQIQQRVEAGVGRRVDFEQAGGRLALAQSNMLTESSNLNDVSARYLRLVGELPSNNLVQPELYKQGIPPTPEEALKQAYQGNPGFNAAIENVRSAQAEAHGRQANFQPRVDLRARKDISNNSNGIAGRRDEQVIELVLNYNLFKGGSDQALVRQYAERLKVAKDLRDKACRDIRQTLSIAYNDTENLSRQLGFLDQHQLSIEKAREAYRKQYDIGQRTLLDLLDTENEYFQARRAYVNASYDHAIAYLRTQAGMGNLLAALQVGRDNLPTLKELGQDRFQVDPASQCPAVVPAVRVASDILTPRKVDAAPGKPIEPQPVALPPETLPQALAGWAAGWSSKDFPRYRDYYAKTFTPEDGVSLTKWSSERAVRLSKPGNITVGIDGLKVSNPEANKGLTEFKQTYTSAKYRDEVEKRIEWVRDGNRWKIQREQVLSTTKASLSDIVKPVKKTKREKRVKPSTQNCDCK